MAVASSNPYPSRRFRRQAHLQQPRTSACAAPKPYLDVLLSGTLADDDVQPERQRQGAAQQAQPQAQVGEEGRQSQAGLAIRGLDVQ